MEETEDVLLPGLGLDMGVFAAKGVLIDGSRIKKVKIPTAGRPVEAAGKCIDTLLEGWDGPEIRVGVMGQNAGLVAESLGIKPMLEIEALQAGLTRQKISADFVLSLGHENMHYLELDAKGQIAYFNRNGQCAAGSGSFWYQQATRMGYNDRELAAVALEAGAAVPISGRCAVFAKSDMTHAINEGATQSAVAAGMARALVDNIVTSVTLNRMQQPGILVALGGVANNGAIIKFLEDFAHQQEIKVIVPGEHEYINAIGAAVKGSLPATEQLVKRNLQTPVYQPEHCLPPLSPHLVCYMEKSSPGQEEYDLSKIYLGVDCGSVSTKCVLLDKRGRQIGGVYLPTTGRPALQVLALMKEVEEKYGALIGKAPIVACTTGSGRFLSQKILGAEYAVDEITCQAEGIKSLFDGEKSLSIIEIGGEDSKFIQLQDGILFDYNMNPVCAAGTGTFLENLAELLGVDIREEFSARSFAAAYAVDLGDICTLISQSILASASARGLPLDEQLASLAYSSARNYLSKTVDKRTLEGKVIFAGATAKNHALASALATVCGKQVNVPPEPELTGALGSALMAGHFDLQNLEGEYRFNSLSAVSEFSSNKQPCRANCKHEHQCMLNVISFADGKKFIYGDRCGRYSAVEKKKDRYSLPAYDEKRMKLMEQAAGDTKMGGKRIGIARCGLYYDYYPFWAVFFRELGCEVVRSAETSAETLQKGKTMLDSEMCYPMKVIVGHYRELTESDIDYVFIPEVVSMEALPWAEKWPRSFVCPLLQTLRGTVVNSVGVSEEKVLYAQLNYREGKTGIREQLRPTAQKILGESYREQIYTRALERAYEARENFRRHMVASAAEIIEALFQDNKRPVAVFLSRGYTLYDRFIAKNSLHYARLCGMNAVPHEYMLFYMQAWLAGEVSSPQLDPYREAFQAYLKSWVDHLENIYPAQLQRILSTVIFINFLNEKSAVTGLPRLNMVFLDPFKCGPNAMLRHYLGRMSSYLRLTLDEHTAAAGMITRLEAFRNTCLTNNRWRKPELLSSQTCSAAETSWNKILIPEPTKHAAVFAAMFRNFGLEAEVLPRGGRGDLSLAGEFVNGEECLPFIQNLQDYFQYIQSKEGKADNGAVFFQGWACGPCRYGLYAPNQSLALSQAGYGEKKVCAVKFTDIGRRFGIGALIGFYNGLLTMDLLYKMLHRTRPYEREAGRADNLFEHYSARLASTLEKTTFKLTALPGGGYRKPLEALIAEAAQDFGRIPSNGQVRPRILLGGEFYVRLDDRCNQEVIKKIEAAGGEVSLAPATEIFTYTLFIDYHETRQAFKLRRKPGDFLRQAAYNLMLKIAHRDETALEQAAGALLQGLEEPHPQEIMERAVKYVSRHYGGEPPMTIGRAAAFAGRDRVCGAIFVAPFTCMPGSVVEAQQRLLQEELGIPIVTVYYDGKDNANRDELVEGLVFQAGQQLKSGRCASERKTAR